MVWTQALRRMVARSVMPRLFDLGYSATAALGVFKRIGPGLRRKLWLADWREITGAKKLERVYRFIPRKFRLSKGLMAPTETFQRKNFKYIMETEVLNTETGETSFRTQSMESDLQLSIEEAEEAWLQQLEDEEAIYAWDEPVVPVKTTLRVVYRKLKIKVIKPELFWVEEEPLGPEWV